MWYLQNSQLWPLAACEELVLQLTEIKSQVCTWKQGRGLVGPGVAPGGRVKPL